MEEANGEVLCGQPDYQRRKNLRMNVARFSSRELSFDPLEQRLRRGPVTAKLAIVIIHQDELSAMWPPLNLAFFVELESYQTAGRYRPRSERFVDLGKNCSSALATNAAGDGG